jgi:hypothetical protein
VKEPKVKKCAVQNASSSDRMSDRDLNGTSLRTAHLLKNAPGSIFEYLWDAAWCLHQEGDPAAEQWVRAHAIGILEGKSSEVAAGMRRSATRRELSQSERAPLDKCAEYLLKNPERLNYAQALRRGLPIATGVVEGACRHLVKQRMECSGARWSLKGAEAVLRLRALHMSGDWDTYLAFHKSQERLRNYPEWPDQQRLAA